jgi:hypothetical protein
MSTEQNYFKDIKSLLINTGLEKLSGSLIYSGNSSLQKGNIYFLGQNPGGNADMYPDDSIMNQLINSNEFNEYLEGNWNGHLGKRHQINIIEMFKDLEIDIKKTFSTNLSFIRSGDTEAYKRNLNEDYKIFWPIHEYCLSIVKPKIILSNGSQAKDFISKKLINKTDNEEFIFEDKYRGRRMKCYSVSGLLPIPDDVLNVKLLSIFHLSKWEYSQYRSGIRWLKNRL